MKLSCLARVAALSLLPVCILSAQNTILDDVFKSEVLLQTSSSAPAPLSWVFSAQSPTASKLTPPGGTAQNLTVTNSGGSASLVAAFATKAAMDLAYPNGTFAFSGPPPATASLTGDLYTASTPQLTAGGTWTNGVLILDPTVDNTLTFSTFSDFGVTGGGQVAGHEDLSINAQSNGDSYSPEQQVLTQPLFGLPSSSVPFSTFLIPAKSLTAGNVYSVELDYDRLTSLDTTTLSGGAVIGIYQKALTLYFAAKSSSSGTLNPPTASIPAAVTGGLGGSVTIPVSGTGLGSQSGATNSPIAIWYFNGAQLNIGQGGKYGVNGQSLVINNVTASDAGSYNALIVGAGGLTTTGTAVLTTVQVSLPVIVQQPQSVTVAQGGTAVFTVAATGTGLSYQWKFGGNNLTSALNGPRLILFGAGSNGTPTGTYSCTVSNGAGSVTSTGATLGIAAPGANPARLINLSVGAIVPSGGSVTLGMTVGGSGTSGQQSLLIRGDGPTLGAAPFNLTGVMADPSLTVVNVSTGANLASNDNWGGAQSIINADNATGAFPFSSASSLDAAVVTAQPAGGYSAVVKNNLAANGYAIAEAFDATTNYTLATPRLINLSTLFTVPAKGSITAGFTVGGAQGTSKTVLIRADGPALGAAPFSLPGVMADPQLTLNSTSNGAQLAVNAGWGGDSQIQAVMNSVGAFGLKPTSLDSAIAVTLSPGGYSATATSSSGGGGQVIIEVYEVQ